MHIITIDMSYISYYINVGYIQMRCREFCNAAHGGAGRGHYRRVHNGDSSWPVPMICLGMGV